MQTFYFNLTLKYDLCEQLYIPGINSVIMKADDGKRIQLPVKNLRPFVSTIGNKGRFRLMIDDNNKITSFEKIA
jgi:hypothetical protein